MKLDGNSQVYINCHTQEEQDCIADILQSLGCRWVTGKEIRQHYFYDPPMHFELAGLQIRHGQHLTTRSNRPRPYPIVEAKDLKNQWISMQRNLDK